MKELFRKKIVATPADLNTHIDFELNVDDNYDTLTIITSYAPKCLYDKQSALLILKDFIIPQAPNQTFDNNTLSKYIPLKNHISWSISSPTKLIGTKHLSHQYQIHKISKISSSSGFEPCEISQGKWIITASINGLFTPTCDILVVVLAE